MAEPAAATGVAATRGGRAAGAAGDVKPRKKARASEPAAGPSPTPPPARRSVGGGRGAAGAAASTAVAAAAAVADAGTGALGGGVPTVPGLGGAGAATEELAFFDELRGVLGDGSTHLYADFIKCLSLFSRHIISRDELLRLADDIFTDSHKHLTDAFRALLASSAPSAPLAATAHLRSLPRPTPSPPAPAGGGPSTAAAAPGAPSPTAPSAAIYRGRRLADVALSRGKKEGSYWEMPPDFVPPVASGMGELEREVLNTRYVAAPARRQSLLRPTPPASSVSSAPGVGSPAPVPPPPPPPPPTSGGRLLVGAAAAAAAGAAAAAAASAAAAAAASTAASTAAGGIGASTADGGVADSLLAVGGGEGGALFRTRVVPDDDRYELDVLIAGVEAAAVKFAKLAALAASSHEASSTAATTGSAVGGGAGNGGSAGGGGGGAGAVGSANGNAALSPAAAVGGGASGASGGSSSGGAWATLTAVDFHALDMVYGRHGRAVVDFVRLNPVLAAPVVLARLRTQLASWKHARRQLGGVWRTEPFRSSSSLTGAFARSASVVNVVEQQPRESGEPPPVAGPSGDDIGNVVVPLPGGAVTVHNNGCMDTPELVGSLLSTRRYGGFWMYSYVRCAPDYLLARRLLWEALEWQLRDGDGAAAVAVTVWLDGFLDSLLGGGGDESDVVSDATAAAPASPDNDATGNEIDGGASGGGAAHVKREPGCDPAADGVTGDVDDGLVGGAGAGSAVPDGAVGSSRGPDDAPSPSGAAGPGAVHVLYGDVPLYTVVRLTAALCDKLHVVNALVEEVRERLLQLLTDALCGRLTIPLYTAGVRALLHLPEAGGGTAGLGATATTVGDKRGDASASAGESGTPAEPASVPAEHVGNGDGGAPYGRDSEKSDAGDTIGSPNRDGRESAMDVDAGEGALGGNDDVKPALPTVESLGISEADANALFNLPLVTSTWAVAVMRVALSPTPTTSALLELHTTARQVDESIYLVHAASSMASSGGAPPSAASSAAGPSPLVRIAYDAGAVALHFHAVPHASAACAACTAPGCAGDCDGSRLLGGVPRGGGTPSVDSSAFVEGRPRAGISVEASEALAASAFASFLRRLRRVPGSRRLRIGADALRSPPPDGAIGSVAARLVHRAESVVVVNGLKLSAAVAAGLPRPPASGGGVGGGGGDSGSNGGGGVGKRRGRLVGRRFVPEGGEDWMYVPRSRPLGRRPPPQQTRSATLEQLFSRMAGGRAPLDREGEGERDGAAV